MRVEPYKGALISASSANADATSCCLSLTFSTGDTRKLAEDLAALKPTIFPSVPRLLNRFYEKVSGGAVVHGSRTGSEEPGRIHGNGRHFNPTFHELAAENASRVLSAASLFCRKEEVPPHIKKPLSSRSPIWIMCRCALQISGCA